MTNQKGPVMKKCFAAVMLMACLTSTAQAQTTYPDRPITLIITSVPGGVTDVTGRALAQELTKAWGQQVIVENKGGAAHIIGAETVAKAAPDGYTLLVGESGPFTINPTLLPKDKVPYDSEKDFIPITGLVRIYQALLAEQIVAGSERRRTDRALQTKAGTTHLRHRRRRLGAAYEHGAVRQHGRGEDAAGALSRRHAGAKRSASAAQSIR